MSVGRLAGKRQEKPRPGTGVHALALPLFSFLMLAVVGVGTYAQRSRAQDDEGLTLQTVFASSSRTWANGDELVLRFHGKVLLRLSYEGYDYSTKKISYRLWLPQEVKLSTEIPPLNLMGVIFSYEELRFIPIDSTCHDDAKYRFFRSINLEKSGVEIRIYFRSIFWPYYSLSAAGDGKSFVLTRVADEGLLNAYEQWRPLVKPNRYPDLEDCYIEVFVRGRAKGDIGNIYEIYGIKVGLPMGDVGGPALLNPHTTSPRLR